MAFLISCQSPKINPKILCDISFQFDRCRCRCFDIMEIGVTDDIRCGEGFASGNYPLGTCEGFSGFILEDWATDILPWGKETRRYYEDTCKNSN